jgi:signal transduction histidine kinase
VPFYTTKKLGMLSLHIIRMRNWYSNSTILIFLFSLFVAEFSLIGEASAGVLFRNRNQVIRTAMPMVQQNYTVRRSTVALRRTSGSISPQPIGTVDDQARLISRHYKYQNSLQKWENKQASLAKKKREKELRLAEKEQKRRAREIQRLRKKQEREENQRAKQLAATKGQGTSAVTSPAASPGSRGALTSGSSGPGASQTTASGSGKGFWRKLLESLFGTKK